MSFMFLSKREKCHCDGLGDERRLEDDVGEGESETIATRIYFSKGENMTAPKICL